MGDAARASSAMVDVVSAIFLEGWNEQRFDNVLPHLSPDLVYHHGATRIPMAGDDLRGIVARWHVGFPDLRFEIHEVIAGEGVAAARLTLFGTHRGPWRGRPATGRSVAVEHMFFFRFEGDSITEVWELLDGAGFAEILEGNG